MNGHDDNGHHDYLGPKDLRGWVTPENQDFVDAYFRGMVRERLNDLANLGSDHQ